MPQIIRTKWHHLIPLIDKDEVYLPAPQDGKAPHWSEFAHNTEFLKGLIKLWSDLPRFVIDETIMKQVGRENFQKSILGMKKAGLMRLPYPAMIVEMGSESSHMMVFLRDLQAGNLFPWETPEFLRDHKEPFYGTVFQIRKDLDGEYLVISSPLFLDIEDINGEPNLRLRAYSYDFIENNKKTNEHVGKTYLKSAVKFWHALSAALLVLATRGTSREVITCERLNRKRAESNKVPIPKHTYVTIGRVYKSLHSDESERYDARRSPIPHWRSGHLKGVRFGPKLSQLKQMYVPPRFVAFDPEQPEPPQNKIYKVK